MKHERALQLVALIRQRVAKITSVYLSLVTGAQRIISQHAQAKLAIQGCESLHKQLRDEREPCAELCWSGPSGPRANTAFAKTARNP